MTVTECALKTKCFNSVEDAVRKIRAGGFRMNHTQITNPEEVMIYGQHIMNNDMSVIRVGKECFNSKKCFLKNWTKCSFLI